MPFQGIKGQIGGDAIDPGTLVLDLRKPVSSPEEPQEGLLGKVVGPFAVAYQMEQIGEYRCMILLKENDDKTR
jgi:hypothetical protein